MLSLFCVLVCVVEQLTLSSVHAIAILVKKRDLISLIGCIRIVDKVSDNDFRK